MNKIFKFIISISIPLLVGFLGSFFTQTTVSNWYLTLAKPFFSPPNWLFGPVWTILFILIGISFYLVWVKGFGKNKKKVILIYVIQLVLNFLWSLCFFGLKSPLLGFIDIILLWILIAINILCFYHISKKAGYLLIPYLLWVSFALLLNFFILILN